MGASQATNIEPQICSLCLSKYQRTRPSTCTCTHCPLLLCSECLNDHINELPQNVTQLSHQCHELEQLFETKQTMVATEILQSTEEINQCIKTYNNNLLDTLQTITVGIGDAKQDAERYLSKINSELQTIRVDIKTLSRESVFQPKRMEALLTQLNHIQEKLETYTVTKDIDLPTPLPKYTLKFQCVHTTTTGTNDLSASEPSESQDNTRKKSQDNTRKKSPGRHKFHPYKKPPLNNRAKDKSSVTDESDSN